MGDDRFFTPLRCIQNDMWVEGEGICRRGALILISSHMKVGLLVFGDADGRMAA